MCWPITTGRITPAERLPTGRLHGVIQASDATWGGLHYSAAVPGSAANFVTRYGPWAAVAGASEGLGAAYADALAAIRLSEEQSSLEEYSKFEYHSPRHPVCLFAISSAHPLDMKDHFLHLLFGTGRSGAEHPERAPLEEGS